MAGKTKFLIDEEKLKAARKKAALSLKDLSDIAYGEVANGNSNVRGFRNQTFKNTKRVVRGFTPIN